MGGRIISLVFVAWLVAGIVAAAQRDHFTTAQIECPQIATIAVTVVAGPLNYLGLNPGIVDCKLPDPSP